MRLCHSNSQEIEKIWKEHFESVDEVKKESSVYWRLLVCRYRMLLIQSKLTVDQVSEFKRTVLQYKKRIKDNLYES